MEKHIKIRLVKNLILSVFIYALPVILMFLSFYLSGQKPWLKKAVDKNSISTTKK